MGEFAEMEAPVKPWPAFADGHAGVFPPGVRGYDPAGAAARTHATP
jgi:hypothetical protein